MRVRPLERIEVQKRGNAKCIYSRDLEYDDPITAKFAVRWIRDGLAVDPSGALRRRDLVSDREAWDLGLLTDEELEQLGGDPERLSATRPPLPGGSEATREKEVTSNGDSADDPDAG